MPSKNIIRYNDFRFKKKQFANKQQAIKRSLFGRSFCCVAPFQSAEKASVPRTTAFFYFLQPRKKGSKKIKKCGSPSSHTLYPSFVGATLSATQTPLKKRGQYCVHRPLCFGGCSTASHQPQ